MRSTKNLVILSSLLVGAILGGFGILMLGPLQAETAPSFASYVLTNTTNLTLSPQTIGYRTYPTTVKVASFEGPATLVGSKLIVQYNPPAPNAPILEFLPWVSATNSSGQAIAHVLWNTILDPLSTMYAGSNITFVTNMSANWTANLGTLTNNIP